MICKNISESGSTSAYIVCHANEYISAHCKQNHCIYTHIYRYIFIQTQDSISRAHKTVHEVRTEETSGLVPMSLITSALHSLPPSCKAPYFSCLHKSVTHPQTFGTDWIAFCRSRFYWTVAKVPLFHCYDILKLAQLVLLLGHCLGRFGKLPSAALDRPSARQCAGCDS